MQEFIKTIEKKEKSSCFIRRLAAKQQKQKQNKTKNPTNVLNAGLGARKVREF